MLTSIDRSINLSVEVEIATLDTTEVRLLTTAARLFGAKGYSAVGIREIALEASISSATMYHYVKSKEELLAKLMVDRLTRLTGTVRMAREGIEEPAGQLASMVRAHVLVHLSFPESVVDEEIRSLSPANRRRVVRLRDTYESIWRDTLQSGAATPRVFEVEEIGLARLALLEMCNGVIHWYSPAGTRSAEEIADFYADSALSLVRAVRGERPLRLADLGLPPVAQAYENVRVNYSGIESPWSDSRREGHQRPLHRTRRITPAAPSR